VDFLKVQIWGRSANAIVAVEYFSCYVVVETLLCTTLGEGVLSLSCVVATFGWCFLVPSCAIVAAMVYLLVLVWLSGIILSSKG